jgi:signal transduction histidine kinase
LEDDLVAGRDIDRFALARVPAEATRLNRAAASAMSGAKRAAALTQRLLAFPRRQPLDPRAIAANGLISDLADLLQRTLGEAISIETVNGAGLWMVEVDPNELEAAIVNLAINAREAMPEDGRLTIGTANAHIDEAYAAGHPEVIPGQYVAISVSDTGIGMDAPTIEQAFEPFFTTKPIGKGTGLGLSQVYGFVKQSGGHAKIYSEVGQGTTTKLYLRRYAGEVASAPSAEEQLAPEGAADTILVVEMTTTSAAIRWEACATSVTGFWRLPTDLRRCGISSASPRSISSSPTWCCPAA